MPDTSQSDPQAAWQHPAAREGSLAVYKVLLALAVVLLFLLVVAVLVAMAEAAGRRDQAEAARQEAEAAREAAKAAEADAAALRREARKRFVETVGALHPDQTGPVVLDEAERRRSMAAHMQQQATQPARETTWAEARDARALKAHQRAAKLCTEAAGHIRQKAWTRAEDALLEALGRLETCRPAGSGWLATQTHSWRWRVLTMLRSVYEPEALDRPTHRAVAEALVRRPTLNGAPALGGKPALIPTSTLAGAETTLCLTGPAGEFRVVDLVGDVSIAPKEGSVPSTLRVRAEAEGLHPFAVDVEAGGKTLTATGVLLVAEWDVRFFEGQPSQGGLGDSSGQVGFIHGEPMAAMKTDAIDFTWWGDPPAANVPADGFSTVATTSVSLAAGTYRVWTSVDDGVRVWIDKKCVIHDWRWRPPRENVATVSLEAGKHAIRIEHYDASKHAQLHVGMEQLQ